MEVHGNKQPGDASFDEKNNVQQVRWRGVLGETVEGCAGRDGGD